MDELVRDGLIVELVEGAARPAKTFKLNEVLIDWLFFFIDFSVGIEEVSNPCLHFDWLEVGNLTELLTKLLVLELEVHHPLLVIDCWSDVLFVEVLIEGCEHGLGSSYCFEGIAAIVAEFLRVHLISAKVIPFIELIWRGHIFSFFIFVIFSSVHSFEVRTGIIVFLGISLTCLLIRSFKRRFCLINIVVIFIEFLFCGGFLGKPRVRLDLLHGRTSFGLITKHIPD